MNTQTSSTKRKRPLPNTDQLFIDVQPMRELTAPRLAWLKCGSSVIAASLSCLSDFRYQGEERQTEMALIS
jgi:hypothetical protein